MPVSYFFGDTFDQVQSFVTSMGLAGAVLCRLALEVEICYGKNWALMGLEDHG